MKRSGFVDLWRSGELRAVPMVVSIGVFDGMHRGHQRIISTCVELARSHHWQSLVVSFDRNPKTSLEPWRWNLQSRRQTAENMAALGVDRLDVIDFSPEFSKLSAVEFMNLLCASCSVKGIVVGEDFRCGNPASCAGPEQLQEYLNRRRIDAKVVVPPFVRLDDGEVVSSTLIRKKLGTGDLDAVRIMLGRPYDLDMDGIAPRKEDGGLWYAVEDLPQMVPAEGTYAVSWAGDDRIEHPLTVRLTGRMLVLETSEEERVLHGMRKLFWYKRYGT